jgi:HNH endonuclease
MGQRNVPRVCEHCGVDFLAYRAFVNKGQARFCSNHCSAEARRMNLADTFEERVVKTPTCWLWTGYKNSYGYGLFSLGRHGKTFNVPVHRFAWESRNGPIPAGGHVLHSCDVPSCVNPDHLRLGTHTENMADMVTRKRLAIGSRHGMARLTEAQVAEIKGLYARGGILQSEIARRYNVVQQTISRIVTGKDWGHVSMVPPPATDIARQAAT